jgi:hypothetical protein
VSSRGARSRLIPIDNRPVYFFPNTTTY